MKTKNTYAAAHYMAGHKIMRSDAQDVQ